MSEKKAVLALAAHGYDQAVRREYGALVCGVDEAGRGPLAGPVVAAAVILPEDMGDIFIYDSKQMTARQREAAYAKICRQAVAWSVGVVDRKYIDKYNILQATYEAMRKAVRSLAVPPALMLVDGVVIPGLEQPPQRRLVKGDTVSQCIAAASILAKVTRDAMMREIGRLYPEYGFDRNMGYGTAQHLKALVSHGPCPEHRRSFAPVRIRVNAASSTATLRPEEAASHPEAVDVRRERGAWAEEEALHHLEGLGYSLLARNWRCVFGEIDLVVVKGDVLAFIEVRSRVAPHIQEALRTAGESVDGNKRRRLKKLAEWFIQEHRLQWAGTFRFDAVLVGRDLLGGWTIEHVVQAW